MSTKSPNTRRSFPQRLTLKTQPDAPSIFLVTSAPSFPDLHPTPTSSPRKRVHDVTSADAPKAISRVRKRTSSTTSIETIRPIVRDTNYKAPLKKLKDRLKQMPEKASVPPPTLQSELDLLLEQGCSVDMAHIPEIPDLDIVQDPPKKADTIRARMKGRSKIPVRKVLRKSAGVPLQSLCPNTTERHVAPPVLTTATTATTDDWGCAHLGPSDLDVSISFFENPISDHVSWPAQINLTVKDPQRWHSTPLALPSIGIIDIQCTTKRTPRAPYAVPDLDAQYTAAYTGARTRDETGAPISFAPQRGVHIEPDWIRTAGRRGWYLKIWIPIPTRLFVKRETRAFTVRAAVTIGEGGVGEGEPVMGEAEMSVSHLRTERYLV
ncbi:hypothetical protein BD779DRAFT_1488897 [Infundibulicybe gibba]|nr:hypothetical protein BD779DRAFT_1488897 [Infundibulicybe gibba]